MALKKPRKIIAASIVLCLLISLAFAFGIVPSARAADGITPVSTNFMGKVKDNGIVVPAGYNVEAKVVGGGTGASAKTDSEGRYGYDAPFVVNGIEGRTIEFYINGKLADQSGIIQEGALTFLNLTYISGNTPTPSSGATITSSKPAPGTYLPTYLRGTILNDGTPVPAGSKVVVKVNGVDYASTTTNAQGQYGFDSVFGVEAQEGDIIIFFINGTRADQTYAANPGTLAQLDLTYKEAPEPVPTNAPTDTGSNNAQTSPAASQPVPSPKPASSPQGSSSGSIAQPVVIVFVVVMAVLCLLLVYMIMKRRQQ